MLYTDIYWTKLEERENAGWEGGSLVGDRAAFPGVVRSVSWAETGKESKTAFAIDGH